MIYIVADLEATCWKKNTSEKRQEIIEIGAVKLNHRFEKTDEFNRFIRPVENPTLSNFCADFTHISQKDVDSADTFNIVFPQFLKWIGKRSYTIVTWGRYDIKQMLLDCRQHSINFPNKFRKKHTNLKTEFAERYGIKPCGMAQALKMLNLDLQGKHHRGIDDARNITNIFRILQQP